jgi:hypothetical protein
LFAHNPHIRYYWYQLRHRAQRGGLRVLALRLVVIALSLLFIVPLFRPLFLGFLDQGDQGISIGLTNILMRVGIVLVSVLSIDMYGVVIRGVDRQVLGIQPVDPSEVVGYALLKVSLHRLLLVPVVLVLLSPIGWVHGWLLMGLISVVVCGFYWMSLALSAGMLLLAVSASQSQRMAPLLDLVRGSNPRAQAAFLYAPGTVLLVAGGVLYISCVGVTRYYVDAQLDGLLMMLLPWVVGVLALVPLPRLANQSWYAATLVIADIDARYALLVDASEDRRVYLDWAVRLLPPSVAVHALRDLRAGWRAHRPWIMAGWLVGVGGGMMAWRTDPVGLQNAVVMGSVAIWFILGVSVAIERRVPLFLQVWLPNRSTSAQVARFLACVGWGQGVVWLAVAAGAIRQGLSAATVAFVQLEMTILVASLVVVIVGFVWRGRLALYLPVAGVGAAMSAAFIVGI